MEKDTSIIPKGDYCYTWKEVPSKSNNFRGKINRCSYYEVKNVNGVEFPWCNYLEAGGIPSSNHWKGWNDDENPEKILIEHFGRETKRNEKLNLSNIFDMEKALFLNNAPQKCSYYFDRK